MLFQCSWCTTIKTKRLQIETRTYVSLQHGRIFDTNCTYHRVGSLGDDDCGGDERLNTVNFGLMIIQ